MTKWTSFWDSFESAVHNNRELSDIEKFNYLSTLLERSAREAISGLSLTSENYREAIATLKKRFGSKQQIINKHMDVLLHMEPVTSAQNIKALRRLFDFVSSHVRSLQSLGVEPRSYGNLLCPVLLNKIPADLQLIVSRKVSEENWNLNSLMEAIEEELTARERIGMNPVSRSTQRREDRSGVPPSATTLVSGNAPSSAVPCCYCNQLHLPVNCDTVTQVEVRRQSLRKSGRCYSCLRKGHLSRDCRSSNRCRTCGARHHTSICNKLTANQSQPPMTNARTPNPLPTSVNNASTLDPSAPVFTSPPTSTSLYVDSSKAILLQTALVEVHNPLNPSLTSKVRVIMDNGSQRSYVTQRVKESLALVASDKQRLSIAAFGAKKGDPRLCEIVRIAIQTKFGQKQELELFVVPHICDPITAQSVNLSSRMYDHLSRLDLADTFDNEAPMKVDMLIGSDIYWDLVTGETIRGQSGPVAVNTRLGWVLSGPAEPVGQQDPTVSLMTTHTLQVSALEDKDTDVLLQSFWELESFGVQNFNDLAYNHFMSNVTLRNGRYEVSLPWREYHEPLPNNYNLSLNRLHSLLQRLKRTPAIFREYDAIIRDQLSKGIVERVNHSTNVLGKVHYLPHHAVIRRNKETTKVRVVYDASAQSNGPSLNNCLYTGPKFNQRILEILLRFRSYPIAWIADIEKAFLMISVAPKDRDALRFLWITNIDSDDPEIIALRFARVVFGVSSSPFLLNATIKHHIEKYSSSHPEIVGVLMQSIYVDDVVSEFMIKIIPEDFGR